MESVTNKIEESLQQEERSIRERFERYKDVGFQVYSDKICDHGSLGHINGYPEYFSFVKEVDYMLQYAILMEVDTIICFDKSARGFGLLANKLFPILRLERARMLGVDPNDIKIPEIRFMDFPKIHGEPIDETKNEIRDLVTKMSGEKVLLFDEASIEGCPKRSLWELNGKELYRWDFFKPELVDRFGWEPLVDRNDDVYTYSGPNIERIKALLLEIFPQKKIYYCIGTSSVAGGSDLLTKSASLLGDIHALFYGIVSRDEYVKTDGSLLVERFNTTWGMDGVITSFDFLAKDKNNPFQIKDYLEMDRDQKIEAIKKWLTKFSQQIRDEHSRMAWELFKQLILKEDPYSLSGKK